MNRTALAVAALAAGTLAAVAESWEFEIENKSSAAVVEFRTQENGEWSKNWIRDPYRTGRRLQHGFRL